MRDDDDVYISIVLGTPPSRKNPLQLAQIEALAKIRSDVELRVGQTGTGSKRDMVVIDPSGSATGVLTLIDGRLEIRNPDERTVQWMVELAQALNARVVDNLRRTYSVPGKKFIHPDDMGSRRALARSIKAARSKSLPNSTTMAKWFIVGIFIIVGAILFVLVR